MTDIRKAIQAAHGYSDSEMQEHKTICLSCAIAFAIEDVLEARKKHNKAPLESKEVVDCLIVHAVNRAYCNSLNVSKEKINHSEIQGELFMTLATFVSEHELAATADGILRSIFKDVLGNEKKRQSH